MLVVNHIINYDISWIRYIYNAGIIYLCSKWMLTFKWGNFEETLIDLNLISCTLWISVVFCGAPSHYLHWLWWPPWTGLSRSLSPPPAPGWSSWSACPLCSVWHKVKQTRKQCIHYLCSVNVQDLHLEKYMSSTTWWHWHPAPSRQHRPSFDAWWNHHTPETNMVGMFWVR